MAASGAGPVTAGQKGAGTKAGAAQRAGHGSKVLAARPGRPTEEQLPSASAGKARRRGSGSRAVTPDMLLPQDFKPRQQPLRTAPRPAPATGGG